MYSGKEKNLLSHYTYLYRIFIKFINIFNTVFFPEKSYVLFDYKENSDWNISYKF